MEGHGRGGEGKGFNLRKRKQGGRTGRSRSFFGRQSAVFLCHYYVYPRGLRTTTSGM